MLIVALVTTSAVAQQPAKPKSELHLMELIQTALKQVEATLSAPKSGIELSRVLRSSASGF